MLHISQNIFLFPAFQRTKPRHNAFKIFLIMPQLHCFQHLCPFHSLVERVIYGLAEACNYAKECRRADHIIQPRYLQQASITQQPAQNMILIRLFPLPPTFSPCLVPNKYFCYKHIICRFSKPNVFFNVCTRFTAVITTLLQILSLVVKNPRKILASLNQRITQTSREKSLYQKSFQQQCC